MVYASRRPATGICYRVLLWEDAALDRAQLESWRARKRELLQAMRDAGIKGSRGRLAELTRELAELTRRCIEEPLAERAAAAEGVAADASSAAGESLPAGESTDAAKSTTAATSDETATRRARCRELLDHLKQDSGVLGCRLSSVSADILCAPTGEEGIDAALERWLRAPWPFTPCAERVIEALSPEDAERLRLELSRDAEQQEELGLSPEGDDEGADAAPFRHVTVLAREAVDALRPAPGRVFIDATLGGGGHTELLLQAGATVWGIDQDPTARRAARRRLAAYGDRLHVIAGNFRNAAELLRARGLSEADGLLADIGISSPQVDCPERGFSFLSEGPLDMRMNPESPRSAADIVNEASEAELADILHRYGEERAARAIARRIVRERALHPISTTTQLADIIAGVLPRKGRQHPATRSFQALRIAVNDELGALDALLESGLSLLRSGGRFAVITFHSLEDRAVKRYFEQVTRPEIDRPEWPAPRPNPDYCASLVFKRPVVAGEDELKRNPRARSAKLRVIEKL